MTFQYNVFYINFGKELKRFKRTYPWLLVNIADIFITDYCLSDNNLCCHYNWVKLSLNVFNLFWNNNSVDRVSGCCPHADYQRLTERSWRTYQLVLVLDPTGSLTIWRVISCRSGDSASPPVSLRPVYRILWWCWGWSWCQPGYISDCKSQIGASVIYNYCNYSKQKTFCGHFQAFQNSY